jgi:DNA-directed RNA polymerase subunit L
MAKKKKPEPEEELEDEFEELEDEIVEEVFPEISKKKPEEEVSEIETPISAPGATEEEKMEEMELEIEEEPEIPEYKYLDLKLSKAALENDYELEVKGQSHDFCNILVKHLLTIKGVNIATYKFTNIEPAKIFIRLEPEYKINDILHKGIESLRDEVSEVYKTFGKLL